MIPSVIEKLGHGAAVLALFLESRMRLGDLLFGSVDLLLGILFGAAFFKTGVDPDQFSWHHRTHG
jgi:hypothetical protein